ncbi:MAG: hypothetical protein ACC645_22455, partial [Pirellulales bacterium]
LLASSQFDQTYLNVASNLDSIGSYIRAGGTWVVNYSRRYDLDLLPGAEDVVFVSDYGEGIDVLAPASGLVTGPGGTIDDSTLDRGIRYGFTRSALPAGATAILSTNNASQVVAFDYPLGLGQVVVHTIAVEFYDDGSHPIGEVFHPNLFAFAGTFRDTGDFLLADDLFLTVLPPCGSISVA